VGSYIADHLVVSLLAKRWYAVPRVVARVNNPKNTWLFTDEWGVDTAVSAPAVMTWPLERTPGATVVAVVRGEQVLAGAAAGPFKPAEEVLALTTLRAEPDLRRLLGGQPGGSHIPAG
jgi:hypothetical protein